MVSDGQAETAVPRTPGTKPRRVPSLARRGLITSRRPSALAGRSGEAPPHTPGPNKKRSYLIEMPSSTQHQGTTTERLDRLEGKVDSLVYEVSDLKKNAGDRRVTDEIRIRRLEDQMLTWDVRWKTLAAVGSVMVGTSIAGLVVGIIGLLQ